VVNNVVQYPPNYSVSGNTLTISPAPSAGTNNVYVRYLSTTLQSITIPGGSSVVGNFGLSGNLQFLGSAQRITGDFSNATVANRVMFQTSTVNGATVIHALPNGTSLNAFFEANNASDPTNSATLQIGVDGTNSARISSAIRGTGTYLPMTFYTGGSEAMRIDTSRNVGVNNTNPAQYATSGKVVNITGTANNSGPATHFMSGSSASLGAGYYCREVFAVSGIGSATEITRITGTGANGMGMYVRVTVNGHSSGTGNGSNYKAVRYDGGTVAVTQVETATSGTVPALTFGTGTNNVLIINLATGGGGGTTFNGVMVVEWYVPIDFASSTWTVS
jgi:hypothetical protein